MGINSVPGNFGTAITPFISMILAVFWGWRMAFLIFSFFQILIGLSFAIIFPNDQKIHSSIDNYTQKEHEHEVPFSETNLFILSILLVLISAARAPVFRCISYFTTVVFKDAFLFTNVESSIFTAITLGVGAFATFLMGVLNNRKAAKRVGRDNRVNFRINSILLSNGASAVLLILLVLISMSSTLTILIVYILLSFFFFLGAGVLPTILSEVIGPSHGMASSMGVLFTGAALTGAVAPTIFGFLLMN